MPKTTLAATLAEQQKDSNAPAYLLEIEFASGTRYYTDSPTAVTFPAGGQVYTPLAFDFNAVINSVTGEVCRVDFSLDNTGLTFSALEKTEDLQTVSVTLKRVFGGLLSSASYAVVIFSGQIAGMDFSESEWRFEALSQTVSLDRPYPPRLFGQVCPWTFGPTRPDGSASECGVALRELTGQTVDAGSTSGTIVDAARTEAADYWRDGVLTITSGAFSGQSRKIAASEPGSVTLLLAFDSAPAAGTTYSIKRGCDKSADTCWRRFDNFENFGGFTTLPGEELVSE